MNYVTIFKFSRIFTYQLNNTAMTTIDLNTATKSEMLSFIASEPSLGQWINSDQNENDMRERFEMWLRLNSLSL